MDTAIQSPSKSKSVDKQVNFDFAIDFDQMKAIFHPMMVEKFGAEVEIKSIDVDVLRSRTKRCVLRYIVNAVTPSQPDGVQWRVIGKIYRAESGQKGFDNMVQLWNNGFSRDRNDNIGMPEPLEYKCCFRKKCPEKHCVCWSKLRQIKNILTNWLVLW